MSRAAVAVIAASLVALAGTSPAAAAARGPAKSRAHLRAVPVVGTRPPALVDLFNDHTHEWLAIDPRALPPPEVVDHFLRDHYTNKSTHMAPKLVHILADAAAHFHATEVHIVSGFRHPKFNLMLRKKGHQVARDSQHTHGDACDFYIPGVTTHELHRWAMAQHLGGVGLYLQSGFVHMDTGPVRSWSGD